MKAKFGRSSLFLSILASVVLGLPQSSLAGSSFQLSPNVVDLRPVGREMVQDFFVASTGDEPVAVQIQMVKREIAPDGTESNITEDQNFLVYPPQMIVKPGQQQVVKVTWVGETDLTDEIAYRAIAEQLPINLAIQKIDDVKGIPIAITLTSKYIASVYVTPNGATPNLVLEEAIPGQNAERKPNLVLTFHNQGNTRGYVGNEKQELKLVSVNSPEKNVIIPGENIQDERGTVILAGNKRQFILPWPKELPVGPVTATFTTN